MTSGNWIKGMIAGFVATVVLSALMIMKAMMGVMPDLNPIQMIADMLGAPPAIGWMMHFMIGTALWGTLFTFSARFRSAFGSLITSKSQSWPFT